MWRFIDIRRHQPEAYDAESDRRHLRFAIALPMLIVALIWIVKAFELVSGIELGFLGVYPRTFQGLIGIITSPLVHSDVDHAFSNSVPLAVMGFLLYMSYRRVAVPTFLIVWLIEGALLWMIGRSGSYHIGASGLVYGLAFFLFFSGVFRLDMRSLALAMLVAFAYGSLVWGIFPVITPPDMSWEAHLAGAIAGLYCAWIFREVDRAPDISWEEEEEPDWQNPVHEAPAIIRQQQQAAAQAQQVRRVPVRYIIRPKNTDRTEPQPPKTASGDE